MPRQLETKGFSVVEVLIVVLVVAALAVGGFFVWQRSKNDDAATKTSTSQNDKQKQGNKKDKQLSDPSEGGRYLVIKEWGMRFPLPDEVRGDVEYGIFTFNNGDQAAYFASKKVAAKSPDGGCGLAQISDSSGQGIFGGTLAVTRSDAKPEDVPGDLSFYRGNYWYTLGFSNGGLCYEGDTGEDTSAFKVAMTPAIRELEPVEQ